MLLHEGLRPFECEGCGKKFARLDALTRHRMSRLGSPPQSSPADLLSPRADKSEQGQECAINHPLPVNPDGSPMSESQYKAYRQSQRRLKREPSWSGYPSGEEDDLELGNGSGMEDYDRV